MIIFSLEALADDSHRRHYIDPSVRDDCVLYMKGTTQERWLYRDRFKMCEPPIQMSFIPDWQAYYDACDKDEPVRAVLDNFIHLTQGEPFNHEVQIWSTNCQSVREKTLKWLVGLTGYCEDFGYWNRRLKMRPIGDNRPAHELKESWVDALCVFYNELSGSVRQIQPPVDFVFESDPTSIRMFRKRGIFVFDCNQSK